MWILIDKTKKPEECIIKVYINEKRATEDFELLNDGQKYILTHYEIFKTFKKTRASRDNN